MREERGKLAGDVVVYEEYTLWGSVGGNIHIIKGGKLYLRGTVYGNLLADAGARVHIFGNVAGDVTVMEKAKLVHSGVIGGNLTNEGGRVYVENMSRVMGKVKTKSGDTQIQP